MFAYIAFAQSGKELIELGEKAAQCGADVRIEGERIYICDKTPGPSHEFISCLKKKLDRKGNADLEHGIVAYDQRFNYNLDSLAEEGYSKSGDETLHLADVMTYMEICGREYMANAPQPEERGDRYKGEVVTLLYSIGERNPGARGEIDSAISLINEHWR